MKLNPYADFGSIVTGERFIGRGGELRSIASRIFGAGGYGSLALIGAPRIGKSSLVAEAIRLAKLNTSGQRFVFLHTDVGSCNSAEELFGQMLADLSDAIEAEGLESSLLAKRLGVASSAEKINFGDLRRVFSAVRKIGLRVVCVLDEFDSGRRIFQGTPECFHWLRELCSNPDYKAAVILVAKRGLREIARAAGYSSGYWSNVLMSLHVKPFDMESVSDFFDALFSSGVALEADDQRLVIHFLGGHPFLLDSFAYYCCERVEANGVCDVEWLVDICARLLQDYLGQVVDLIEDRSVLQRVGRFVLNSGEAFPRDEIKVIEGLGLLSFNGSDVSGFSVAFDEFLKHLGRGGSGELEWREEIVNRAMVKWLPCAVESPPRSFTVEQESRVSDSPPKLFYSYSHADELLRDELAKHLTILERQSVISSWHDRKIGPGEEWDREIRERLEEADIILLLVSADFLASEYIWEVELATSFDRHRHEDAIVIPIILRPCDWRESKIGTLQALPKDGRAVTSWADRDEALASIAASLRRSASLVNGRRASD